MTEINYITLDDAIKIHQQTIKHSGGGATGRFDDDEVLKLAIYNAII